MGNSPDAEASETGKPSTLGSPPAVPDAMLGQFLTELLSVQCHCCRATRGAVLHLNGGEEFTILAVHPAGQDSEGDSDWLRQGAKSARRVLELNRAHSVPLQGSDRTHIISVPLDVPGSVRVAETFVLKAADKASLESTGQLLQLTAGLVSLTNRHLSQERRHESLEKMRQALKTLSAANRHNRFTSVAMSVCNELASQWRCERVSLGFVKGRYVRIKAVSHAEHFGRKMRLIQDIEAVMEECLDQDCEVLFPAAEESSCVSRAAKEFSSQHDLETVLSLPLRQEAQPHGVITLERPVDQSFTNDEVEAIRLTCDLCTPRLMNLHHYDRWFGARMAATLRRALSKVVGAEHTWAKLGAILVFSLGIFLTFAEGWYRVEAPFTLEAVLQYRLAAPFDGYLKDVTVEVGDQVIENQTPLAQLDTAELRLQLAAAQAEKAGYLKQADAAMRDNKIAEAQIAQANADKAQAQIDLYSYRITQAQILSPLTGLVVTGDLKRQIGAPVETGKILFEIAPLDSLRAELYVPEDEAFEVRLGQQGRLATASFPGEHIRFIVERLNPAAEVVNNRNVFRVRVRLLETRPWMRAGMEGVARITIEKRRYAWIWSRKVVNWVRMKLWI